MAALRDIIMENDRLASAILRENLVDLDEVLIGGAPVNYAVEYTVSTPLMMAVGKKAHPYTNGETTVEARSRY